LRHEVPHDLDAVVMRAIAKDPDQRYQSAEEMDGDLARVARGAAVAPRTEEALTSILAGTAAASATMIAPASTAPPAPPAYRPPGPPPTGFEGPARRRAVWPWLLAILAVVIAAAAGYLLYTKIQDQLNQNKPIAVVDVTLVRGDLAAKKLHAEGFKVNVALIASDTVPKGEVVSQNPRAGELWPKHNTVTIYISSGKPTVRVPAVRGFTLTQALSMLADANLRSKPVQIYSAEADNTVIAQAPRAGKNVVVGSVVRINVSRGPKPVSVPNVVGDPVANAESALKGAGFSVTQMSIDSDAPKGQVVAQDPVAGAQATAGSKVTLSVSKGTPVSQVPDVTGQSEADAKALLSGAGFKTHVQREAVLDPSQDGLVASQTPVGGSNAKKGITVTIVVGKYTAPPVITTTTTTPAATTTTPPVTTTIPAGATTTVPASP
jgi:beta-lactam-binding protein with PASTA domain